MPGRRLLWLAPVLALICALLVFYLHPSQDAASRHIYLTWQGDPATTITVNFHQSVSNGLATVVYDLKSAPQAYQWEANSQMSSWFAGRGVYQVQLTGLEPDTTYYFKAGTDSGMSEELHFRTLPRTGPVRFVTGGDMGTSDLTAALLQQAAAQDPMFAVLGGDLAYANGKVENSVLWDRWLDLWFKLMRTGDGGLIPMVVAVGNHETDVTFAAEPGRAPFFEAYFSQAEKPYMLKTFSDTLALLILDTGHTVPIEGEQTRWLEQQLQTIASVPNRMAVYHVPLYPSHRSFEGERSVRGREHWGPLFDKYKVTACFENHDHAFKRTFPLKGGRLAPDGDGVIYLGDGCFGVSPRTVEPIRWYEEKAESRPHFWLVEADAQGVACRAIDWNGELFDEVRIPVR